jgi:hypothetical protein
MIISFSLERVRDGAYLDSIINKNPLHINKARNGFSCNEQYENFHINGADMNCNN